MRLGMVSDVHGNRVALEAVVAEGRRLGVERWWALGDLAAIGPEPVETLARLADLPGIRFVQGNTDRYVVTGQRPRPTAAEVDADPTLRPRFESVERSFSWTRDQVDGTAWLDWLGELPMELSETLPDGTRLLGVHVLPGRDDGPGITPHRAADELREAFAGVDADVVVAGHTHQPTDRWIDGVRAVNLGSVSNPVTDDLRASFVVLHADHHGHRLEHRRVAYDHAGYLEAIERSGHPERDFLESFVRGEQVEHPATRPGAPAQVPAL